MKKLSTFILTNTLALSLIVLCAQTGNAQVSAGPQPKTCYLYTEMEKIAANMLALKETRTLLFLEQQKTARLIKDTVAAAQQISLLKNNLTISDSIVANKQKQINEHILLEKKLVRRQKWTKFGWAATFIAESVFITVQALKR